MPMCSFIEYSDIYSKTWKYFRDNFCANKNNSISFKFEEKIAGEIENNGKKDDVIMYHLNI